MSDVRKEKDSLGFVEVPSKAYYGAQTARAVDNFPISGMRAHPSAHPRPGHGEARRRGSQQGTRPGGREACRRHHPGGPGSHRRQVERRVRGRCFPGRGGRQPAHEHQRGDRQPGQRDPGRKTGGVRPHAPQRPRELRAVDQRRLPHCHAPGDAAGPGRVLPGAGPPGSDLCGKSEGLSPHHEVRPHAHAGCGADAPGAGVCGLRHGCGEGAAIPEAGLRRRCASWGWAAAPWARASTPIPITG